MALKSLPGPDLAIAGLTPPTQYYAEWFASLDSNVRANQQFAAAADANAAGHALAAADLLGGILLRSGPAGAFSDTTPSAATLIGGIPGALIGTSRLLFIGNNGGGLMTLLAGSGVTLQGNTTIAAGSGRWFLITVSNIAAGAEAVSIRGLMTGVM